MFRTGELVEADRRAVALPQSRDRALDGLRGVAIVLVFAFHYGGGLRAHNPLVRAFGYVAQAGWSGVNLFFALSGFLITKLLMEDLDGPRALRNFFVRRALRILPLYDSALAVCALAALLAGAAPGQLRPLLVYAAFLQNLPGFLGAAAHAPPPLPIHHLWSLAVEEQFYLLWPFLLLIARSHRRVFWLCLGVFAGSCLVRSFLFCSGELPTLAAQQWTLSLPVRGGALALGGALAVAARLYPETQLRAWACGAAAISLATWLLIGAVTGSFLLKDRSSFLLSLPAVDLLAAALVALALQPGRLRRGLGQPALAFLGRISYGFYVVHILLEPCFDWLGALVTHETAGFAYQAARLGMALPLTTAVAWIGFHALEQPFLRLKRYFPRHGTLPQGREEID